MVVRIFGLFEINGLDLCGRKNLLYIMFCPFFFFFFFCDGIFSFLFAPAAFFLLKTEILLLRGRYQKKKKHAVLCEFLPTSVISLLNLPFKFNKKLQSLQGWWSGNGRPAVIYREVSAKKSFFERNIRPRKKKNIYVNI